jgi:hypothetical protein
MSTAHLTVNFLTDDVMYKMERILYLITIIVFGAILRNRSRLAFRIGVWEREGKKIILIPFYSVAKLKHLETTIINQNKNKKVWEELIAYFPLYDTGHIENDMSNNSTIVVCVFVTAVTFLPSRCLVTIG